MDKFQQVVQYYRSQRDLTLDEFATYIQAYSWSITKAAVSYWERGQHAPHNADRFQQILERAPEDHWLRNFASDAIEALS